MVKIRKGFVKPVLWRICCCSCCVELWSCVVQNSCRPSMSIHSGMRFSGTTFTILHKNGKGYFTIHGNSVLGTDMLCYHVWVLRFIQNWCGMSKAYCLYCHVSILHQRNCRTILLQMILRTKLTFV